MHKHTSAKSCAISLSTHTLTHTHTHILESQTQFRLQVMNSGTYGRKCADAREARRLRVYARARSVVSNALATGYVRLQSL